MEKIKEERKRKRTGNPEVGERIKKARVDAGFKKQRELAEAIEIDTSLLGQYEVAMANPSLDVLVKISNACNVSTDWLLKGGAPTMVLQDGTVFTNQTDLIIKEKDEEIIRLKAKLYDAGNEMGKQGDVRKPAGREKKEKNIFAIKSPDRAPAMQLRTV